MHERGLGEVRFQPGKETIGMVKVRKCDRAKHKRQRAKERANKATRRVREAQHAAEQGRILRIRREAQVARVREHKREVRNLATVLMRRIHQLNPGYYNSWVKLRELGAVARLFGTGGRLEDPLLSKVVLGRSREGGLN